MNDSLEYYRKLLFNSDPAKVASFLNFSFVLKNKLAGMGLLSVRNDPVIEVKFLKESGITHIVNLTENDYLDPGYRETFMVLDLPVEEFEPPTMEQMNRVYTVSQQKGVVLAAHCAAGKGRTGTVLACIIGRRLKMPGDQAILEVRKRRKGSIESHSQEEFIRQYVSRF